ncbi:MAG: HEPN domain-containing protein [Chloroflexota bacterium]
MQRAQDWLIEARAELRAARDLLSGQHWSWCCFTCQQASEKALKAICEHFRSPQFGHNLNMLLQAVETHTSIAEAVHLACARLNRYYILTRYPDAFDRGAPADQFFEADARQALADAEEVQRFAEHVIGTP